MRNHATVICVALIVGLVALGCLPLFAASSYKSPDGGTNLSAAQIEFGTYKIVANNNAQIKSLDKVTKTAFEANAKKIVVSFFSALGTKGAAQGIAMIKNADFTGPVKLIYSSVDPTNGNKTTTTATADSAVYNGAEMMAYLTGNVKIVSENPAMFTEPAVMTGDKATVNLKPNPGADDFRFKVESNPGVSTIEVTPKPKAQEQK